MLVINDKTYKTVKKLGSGKWSKVWELTDGQVIILTDQNDITKAAIKDYYNWFGNSREFSHLPIIKYVGEYTKNNKWYDCYITTKYHKLTKQHKAAYTDFELITNLYAKIDWREWTKNINYQLFQEISNQLPTKLQTAFNYWLEALSNYDDIDHFYLDVPKHNFLVDDMGNLILYDIFAYGPIC
jgi:hypothetical protein